MSTYERIVIIWSQRVGKVFWTFKVIATQSWWTKVIFEFSTGFGRDLYFRSYMLSLNMGAIYENESDF